MKKLLLAAVGAISLGGAAHAGELVCNMQDAIGNRLTYVFGPNTYNANGTYGGTLVETGFERNGHMVISEHGVRPIWIYGGNRGGGFNLYSRSAPGWSLRSVNGEAILAHNGRVAGNGFCNASDTAWATAANVGDQGY
jgi:opacity protein-like surface antigen